MSLPEDKKWIIGVDLGGTNISVGVLPMDGGDGHPLALRNVPTEAHRGAKFVVDRIVQMIRDAMKSARREADIPDGGFIGVGRGSRIALMARNRPKWPISDLAIQSLGAATVPIYPTLEPEPSAISCSRRGPPRLRKSQCRSC